jgi:hypothetical protein
MNNENQNDEQVRRHQANMRLAWVLGVISASVFVFMIYYLRAK